MCVSSARAECVPALCTHRPSQLPIGMSDKSSGGFSFADLRVGFERPNLLKSYILEEAEVVTRSP